MDPMKEPKEEPLFDNGCGKIAQMGIKDEVMGDDEKMSIVATGGAKREVSSGVANKKSSQTFGQALLGINNNAMKDNAKNSIVATGGAKREVSSGIAKKTISQSFGKALLGIKNQVIRDVEKGSSFATVGLKKGEPSVLARNNYSVGSIKPSMTMQKVTKPKVQPKRKPRKVEEWEESSEEEYEDDYDSEEESDGTTSEESDNDETDVTKFNPSKCEEFSATKHASSMKIGAKFTEISKLVRHLKVSTATTQFAGITWKMNMQKFWDQGLLFSLEAENKNSTEWVCLVTSELRFYSSQSKETVMKTKRKKMVDSEESVASIGFLTREDLFDKETGFVTEEDAIYAIGLFKVFPRSLQQIKENSICAQFTEISKITKVEVHSSPFDVAGATWKMSVNKERFDQYSFKLYGENKNERKWWCPVIAELRLISQKTGEIVLIAKEKHVYEAGHEFETLVTMMKEDLFDDKKGFVKDDSIFVDILIKSFPIN